VPIRLLVHHGAYPNFGDLAMLETALDRLAQMDDVELHVQDAPLEWQRRGARPLLYKVLEPGSIVDRILRIGIIKDVFSNGLPRVSSVWRSMAFRLLAKGRAAGALPVRTTAGWSTLGRWCGQYDALFISGGGDMNDCFPEALGQYCALIHAFANQGKPVILSGQQLGPVDCAASRELLFSALRRSSYVVVREPTESLRLCQEAGLREDQFAMSGDDSLGMPAAGDCAVHELMGSYQIASQRFIAVNLRIAPYNDISRVAIKSLVETLGKLSTMYGAELVLVPISIAEGDSDIDAGRELGSLLGEVPMKVIGGGGLSAPLIKGLLAHAIGAIGVSYHFNTFALSQGVPAVAIYSGAYYRQKANGLAAFWGDARLAMPIEHLGAEAELGVRAVFDDLLLRKRLKLRAEQAAKDWEEHFSGNIIARLESLRVERAGCPR
jgi:polysaccharide pyruvyl transferase WcaK-like protein